MGWLGVGDWRLGLGLGKVSENILFLGDQPWTKSYKDSETKRDLYGVFGLTESLTLVAASTFYLELFQKYPCSFSCRFLFLLNLRNH